MGQGRVRQRRLGRELRRLRERTGLIGQQAGESVGISKSMVSLIETGNRVPKEPDLEALLRLYAVNDTERAGVIGLYEDARRRDWLSDRADILSESFRDYLSLEPEATMICRYEPQYVPGLLQTVAYARAMISSNPDNSDRIDRLASVRIQRQQVLFHDKPPQCVAVIDESALQRPVGGREVLREQLLHLIEMTERSNVTIQLVPFERTAFGDGPFTILRLPDPGGLDAVYLESLAAETFLDEERDTRAYGVVFERLQRAALSSDASAERIANAAEELGAHD